MGAYRQASRLFHSDTNIAFNIVNRVTKQRENVSTGYTSSKKGKVRDQENWSERELVMRNSSIKQRKETLQR